MPRSKKPRTELIRVTPQPAIPDLATLDLLIQKRVAEATASQGAILEPWFQSKAVGAEIRRHQPVYQQRKWSLYFEKFGCVICRSKKTPHQSRGMCHPCSRRLVARLVTIEREYAKAHPHEYENQQIDNLTSRLRSAERRQTADSSSASSPASRSLNGN
jgi:hypothetical protein